MEQHAPQKILESLHTFSPILLVFGFCAAQVFTTTTAAIKLKDGTGSRQLPQCTNGTSAAYKKKSFSPITKGVFNGLSVALLATYFAEAAVCVTHVVIARSEQWWCGQSVVIYITGSTFFYIILLISLIETPSYPTATQLTCWSVAILTEVAILCTSLVLYCSPHRERAIGDPLGGPVLKGINSWEIMKIVSNGVRIVTLAALILLYASKSGLLASEIQSSHDPFNGATETTRLLESSPGDNHINSPILEPVHGRSLPTASQPQDPRIHCTTIPSRNGWKYVMGYSIFLPYLWPSKSHELKIVTLVCLFLLVVQRINNVMIPIQIGVITTALASQQEAHTLSVVWPRILLYVFCRWLQTGLSSLRSALWIPVSQYSRMELSTSAFEHVHNLGLDFHLNKETGEVLSALNKGKSVTGLLEQVVFEFFPTLFDLFIAIGYFLIAFDAYYALVVGISSFSYIYVTIRMSLWRAQTRREMANASRHEDAVKNESVVAYQTVKLFNAEQHEFHRYRTAVSDYQKTEYYSSLRSTVLNTVQNTVLMTSLLCTCFIAAYQVSTVQKPVGLFVTLLMYMAQLQGPLGYFGSFYLSIQSSLINAERILELFREQSTVVDSKLATPLVACKGEIRFQNVKFFYDDRKVLFNGLTFTCKPGTTTALVGESGVGKSTIFQILYRFYNPADGSVHVDGYDVRDLTGDSIRRHVSIVPQHLALFNESLMYNLKYANQNATDEEVHNACRAAGIHDKIMAFPDGYDSKVGDLGLRLSGGEKQRVAIARTILKNTRIILLDEATSALDAGSETFIQRSLKTFSYDRTILVIAHRLSTITGADCILVLHEGRVVERGTHAELLELNGRYADMWRNHTRE